MTDLVIDGVSEELYEQLRQQAEKNKRSIEDEALRILLNAVKEQPQKPSHPKKTRHPDHH